MLAAAATGFDLGSAIVLGLVIMGLVTMVHTLVYGPNPDRVKVVSCLGVSFVAVELVAASDFAHEQVILNRALDSLNFWSQMVVVLLAAGIASGVWNIGVKAISNVGQVMPKYPTHKANGKQPLAGTGLTGARSSSLSDLVARPGGDGGYPGGAPTVDDLAALAAAEETRNSNPTSPPA